MNLRKVAAWLELEPVIFFFERGDNEETKLTTLLSVLFVGIFFPGQILLNCKVKLNKMQTSLSFNQTIETDNIKRCAFKNATHTHHLVSPSRHHQLIKKTECTRNLDGNQHP